MKRVLITGVDGFTGRYVAQELHRAGYVVHGMVRKLTADGVPGVQQLHPCDLSDAEGVRKVIEAAQPQLVVHLAAIAFVGQADAALMYQTNVVGTRNILEALVNLGTSSGLEAVLVASSANIYGNATPGVISEDAPYAPANDYAVSKVAMEYLCDLYRERLPLIVTRPFNYTGVGQSLNFVVPKIVDHATRRAPQIELGNLDVARDFSDVRYVAQVYRCLLECPAAIGTRVNVCSGQAYTLSDVLSLVAKISGHTMDVRVNPAFVRANEVKVLQGDGARLTALVGKVPPIALADTLQWMLGG